MSTVSQLLARKPKGLQLVTVEPESPVLEAIKLMAEHGIGALLVMKQGELAGIISERDYARKVILMGRSSADTPVSQIMTTNVTTVRPHQSAQECMSLMTNGRFRHLPVMEGGRVVGLLSIGDLVRAVLEEQQQTIEQLEHYIRS